MKENSGFMYAKGTHVFYPKGGVFKIESLSSQQISGRDIPVFNLVSRDEKTKITIPQKNMERVGVRSLLEPEEMETVMGEWAPDTKIQKLHHKNRKNRFELLRQSGDFRDMGTVLVTIHKLMKVTKATFEEKRMYDQVRKRLTDEISIVKGFEREKAEHFLTQELDKAIERKGITSRVADINTLPTSPVEDFDD
jgi:RNA polymerase-interacting CarD/CdnL/TRCF family regulator